MGKVSSEFTEINRSRAKAVKDRLERMGLTITLGQAYEVVATAHGYRNWPVMKASASSLVQANVSPSENLPKNSALNEFFAQFSDFIELRQKRFLPKNSLMVIGGDVDRRRRFVDDAASKLKLGVRAISMNSASAEDVGEAFSTVLGKGQIVFVDNIERCCPGEGGTGGKLAACIDVMPPGQFVIMGAGVSVESIDLSLLRRAKFRHILDE